MRKIKWGVMGTAFITSDYNKKNIRMRRETLGGCTYDLDRRIDRFEIQGTKGSIRGSGFRFNGDGELSYTVTTFDGEEETKKISVLQNYRLEVEQLGHCVAGEETPAVTKEFSLTNARIIDRILKEIGY